MGRQDVFVDVTLSLDTVTLSLLLGIFGGMGMGRQDVLVDVTLSLDTVTLSLLLGIFGALASSFHTINDHIWFGLVH